MSLKTFFLLPKKEKKVPPIVRPHTGFDHIFDRVSTIAAESSQQEFATYKAELIQVLRYAEESAAGVIEKHFGGAFSHLPFYEDQAVKDELTLNLRYRISYILLSDDKLVLEIRVNDNLDPAVRNQFLQIENFDEFINPALNQFVKIDPESRCKLTLTSRIYRSTL